MRSRALAVCALLVARAAPGGVAGSAHDFTASGWNSSGEICLPCHTPHDAIAAASGPLWNHTLSTATYTLYSSATLDASPEQPRDSSKLCLSCHDGAVALDSFGGATGTNHIGGSSEIGLDLSDDHPISILWDHQTLDGAGDCGTCHNQHAPLGNISPLRWFDSYVECATCHDVHNTSGYPKLLRMTQQGSALCLHCHKK